MTLAGSAAAQTAGPWGQCGGLGYSGPTECPSGWYCAYQNDWYSQCLEGAASTSTSASSATTALSTSSSLTSASSTTTSAAPTGTGTTCPGSFDKMSAEDWVAAINPGWNVGNTLDAVPDEGSWNNPPVVASTFDVIKAAGFKSVRIPVTYAYHFDTEAPDYIINADWLNRVSEVVDMATDRGLYVLTNVHHDSWIWADATSGADKDVIREKFYRTWLQIGEKLACKSSMVGFESINEPLAETAEDGAFINELNAIFLRALEETGGFNTDRVVTLVGGFMDPAKTSQWFEPPETILNPWALQYHYYSPYDFIFSAWGKTTWGSAEEAATLEAELDLVPSNFSVPLVLGEFDASFMNTEAAARWKWFDAVGRAAAQSNTALMLWDNGVDNLNRETEKWRDLTAIEIMIATINGEANSLPDATTDTQATEQESSAYVFHKYGDAAPDSYELTFTMNGNSLVSITTSNGTPLSSPADYSISGGTITLTGSFLAKHLSATAAPGVKETLTFTFSEGASPEIQIVVWDIWDFEFTTADASESAGADIQIPVKVKGIERLAAVKMAYEDGTFMFDDWTQWLGPLQQGRATFNSQWYYEYDIVWIRQAVIDAVVSRGQGALITFEFFPRVEGNALNFTLTV